MAASFPAPITIYFMLTIFVSPEPEKEVNQWAQALGQNHWDSPAGKETRNWLLANELIDRVDFPRATEKGRAWINYICATPLPERVEEWRLPARVHS